MSIQPLWHVTWIVSCRLNEHLDEQQAKAAQQSHRATAILSALDELQQRREVSDSARGRLRGILSAPLEGFSGAVSGGGLRSSGLIRQSSRLSGIGLGEAGRAGGGFYFCLIRRQFNEKPSIIPGCPGDQPHCTFETLTACGRPCAHFCSEATKKYYAGLPTTVCFAQNILHSMACHMHRCSSSILLLIDAYHICHR